MTWDPVNGTQNAKAIPGGKRRALITITNPDIVATEPNALAVIVPTPNGMAIALDGDGASSGSAIRSADGGPASGLAFSYDGPASTSDQVDFSPDGGMSWSFVPIAGNAGSQRGVSSVRLRPLGSMAPGSSYSFSIPYSVQ